ncbi:MAG: transposase, partial [Ktedonobacteraceae bacterium]
MSTLDRIIQIFCIVDDEMKDMAKHTQATLYPCELVTIGILFALKGGHFRAFYRWLHRDYATVFAGL